MFAFLLIALPLYVDAMQEGRIYKTVVEKNGIRPDQDFRAKTLGDAVSNIVYVAVEADGEVEAEVQNDVVAKTEEEPLDPEAAAAAEILALEQQERNLTDLIHVQGIVVANATEQYLQSQGLTNVTDAITMSLQDKFDEAESKEKAAQTKLMAHEAAVKAARARVEDLRNKTDEANATLTAVKPKYLVAEAAYHAALLPSERLNTTADDAQADLAKASAASAAAGAAGAYTDAQLTAASNELQEAMDALNELNDELVGVQDEQSARSQ